MTEKTAKGRGGSGLPQSSGVWVYIGYDIAALNALTFTLCPYCSF